jgi:hypothetical protein
MTKASAVAPRWRWRWRWQWRKIAVIAACAPLVSCALGGASAAQPVLKISEVVGTWSNHQGSTVIFQADQHFSAAGMDMAPNLPGCGDVSGTGNWSFDDAQGNSPPPGVSYTKGNHIELAFNGQNDACNVTLTSWEINPPVGLCLDFDPDSPCTGTPWTKKG